ncbi:LEF-9 [Plodia interpunctella granulovirus]|uniref:LEF-9 n=1 Tax=Plodia interpunctella granulovirus TaxID=262175 RepID=A0A1L5JH56_9BBAC|nr:LEF-9 [Plodia interpunctella granulovirus]APO13986.1 LEF-9 [Plodia interpunctella granulovirus]
MEVRFEKRDPTTISILKDVSRLSRCVFMKCDTFSRFVRDVLNYLKQTKCTYYNSVLGQLITTHQEGVIDEEYAETLSRVLLATNVIVTDIDESVFLKKLKINKFTDSIDYLILPNFTLWDHNFLVFLNKKFNSKKVGGLVNVWGAMQKISLTQGVIKDLIQNKNGYAGQYLYSTFLNTGSFYANVQCFNGVNEIKPPPMSVARYYGRRVDEVRAWNTRHPNISQLSTQFSKVVQHDDENNWNVKVGLGTFVGANRDCDGDKEVITFLPYPNSLIELESLLYNDPKYSFLSFDKNKLSFVSQQILYLYRRMDAVEREFKKYPGVYRLWNRHRHADNFSHRLDRFFTDTTLVFSSNMVTLLFQRLCALIDDDSMVCSEREVFELTGCFQEMVESGAKGSSNLIENTKQYSRTVQEDVDTVARRAIDGLNSHITSHGRVKFSGGDIYHNTVIFLNLYLKNNNICYKKDDLIIGSICNLPDSFLFPPHLLDLFID